MIDRLMDEGSILCGLLDKSIVQRLLSRGLVYLDVPVNADDFVFVPTLDGFVMNRVGFFWKFLQFTKKGRALIFHWVYSLSGEFLENINNFSKNSPFIFVNCGMFKLTINFKVQGDYFETLLYKIFVAIDGQNSIKEVSLN